MRSKWSRCAAVVAATTFISACNETTALPAVTDLATARELWSQKEPLSYEFTFEKSCFCGGLNGPLVVSVRDGVVQSVRTRTGRALEQPWDDDVVLVGEVFSRIEYALAHGGAVHGEYDGQFGYPKGVLIDYLPGAADDEVWYNFGGLHATRTGSSEFFSQRDKLPF